MGILGGSCCCCICRAYSFPDHLQVLGSAHFHVWSPNIWWLWQSFPAGLTVFFLGCGHLGCTLSSANASSSLSMLSGTTAATWLDLAPRWRWFRPNQRLSAKEVISLELRLIHTSKWLLTLLGSLVTYSILNSMVSISWEGLLSPPKMSLRHVSAGLGVQQPALQSHVGAI